MHSLTTESSMYERPDWPLNALSRVAIERLFALMSATYGSRFASLWSGTDPVQMQKVWAVELWKLSEEQRKAGIANLTALPKPPTLPEYLGLCRQARAEQAASQAPQIGFSKPADEATVRDNLARIKPSISRILRTEPTAEWAFTLLLRGKGASGSAIPFSVRRCASDAVTSSAGARVVATCQDAEMRSQYEALRESVIAEYAEAGRELWSVK